MVCRAIDASNGGVSIPICTDKFSERLKIIPSDKIAADNIRHVIKNGSVNTVLNRTRSAFLIKLGKIIHPEKYYSHGP